MPISYRSYREQVVSVIRERSVTALARSGFAAEAHAKRGMPVLTGNARRSVHTVVVDEQGRPLRSPGSDENGRPIPRYPATGRLTSFVGSNAGYVRHIRRKGGGMASVTVPLFASALDAGSARLPGELRRAMQSGGGRD